MSLLKSIVRQEIEQAEDWLQLHHSNAAENWLFYKGELPARKEGEAGIVAPVCQSTVDQFVAICMDTFGSKDVMAIKAPIGVNELSLINKVIYQVFDIENNRYNLFQSAFKSGSVSGIVALRAAPKTEVKIDKRRFKDARPEEVAVLEMTLAQEHETEVVITEEREEIIKGQMVQDGMLVELSDTVTLQSGYIQTKRERKTVVIDYIPSENFIVNQDASDIKTARCVGHKANVTISDLLQMGFDEDKVREAYESADLDTDNQVKTSRDGYQNDYIHIDKSNTEVELYELYIRTSVVDKDEDYQDDDEFDVTKLYRVFYTCGGILSYDEVDYAPYVAGSPVPIPGTFWGKGIVDLTRKIQTAKSGLQRQTFEYNALVNKPRFQYNPEMLNNVKDIFNPKAGAGISVKGAGAVAPIQLMAQSGQTSDLFMQLDTDREVSTGISLTGQNMVGDVLKSGASTISAQMVLNANQLKQKQMIQNFSETIVKPLWKIVYRIVKDMDEWELMVDGQTVKLDPSIWPDDIAVEPVGPLGPQAKLEEAAKYNNLLQTLTTSPNPEIQKLLSPTKLRGLFVTTYKLQGLDDVEQFLASDEEIVQKDQMIQALNTMQQQMQQMTMNIQQLTKGMQSLTVENTQLKNLASEIKQAEVAIKQQDVDIKQERLDIEASERADKIIIDQEKADVQAQNLADKQALEEEKFDLYKDMAKVEQDLGTSIYQSV